MSTTKNKYFLVLLAFAMIAGACGGGSADTATEEPAPAAEQENLDAPATTAVQAPAAEKKLKVGIVLGALGDRSFMDSAKRGYDQAVAELAIEGDYVEAEPSERAVAIQNFLADGKEMIITIGFSEAEITKEAAVANPDVQFAIIDMVITADDGNLLPNVYNLVFKEHEGSFEVGYIAGKLSKTGKVAFMGGMDVPIIRKFHTGWEEGAKYANPDIEFCSGYAGSWGDPAKGKEIGLSCFEQGADIIFAAGGATGDGAYEAAAETGNYAVGVDSNQDYIHPGVMITSMMKNVDYAVYTAISDRLAAGAPGASIVAYGSAENGVGPSWLVDGSNLFKETGPADMVAQVDDILAEVKEVRAKIISGEIVVTDASSG